MQQKVQQLQKRPRQYSTAAVAFCGSCQDRGSRSFKAFASSASTTALASSGETGHPWRSSRFRRSQATAWRQMVGCGNVSSRRSKISRLCVIGLVLSSAPCPQSPKLRNCFGTRCDHTSRTLGRHCHAATKFHSRQLEGDRPRRAEQGPSPWPSR